MIAIDTNILVYAFYDFSPWHGPAKAVVQRLAEAGAPWAIPYPVAHEFLAISTNPNIFKPAPSMAAAVKQLEAWAESPDLVFLSEGPGYLEILQQLLKRGQVVGGKVHDARIAALCLHHQVAELWSADRDFGRFPSLKVKNPLV
jgi:uncharacterized protein